MVDCVTTPVGAKRMLEGLGASTVVGTTDTIPSLGLFGLAGSVGRLVFAVSLGGSPGAVSAGALLAAVGTIITGGISPVDAPSVGCALGCALGTTLGKMDGTTLDRMDGTTLGRIVGSTLGNTTTGSAVGCKEGWMVGSAVD